MAGGSDRESEDELKKKFLAELASSLDFDSAAAAAGIKGEEARAFLLSFLRPPAKVKGAPAEAPLFEAGVYTVNVDGGSRGNPGPAGAGAIVRDPAGKVVKKLSRYLGVATNNIAEYEALILALEEVASIPGAASIKVFADSELVVKQIRGEYRVKNEALKGLYAIATKLIESFSEFEISHIPRDENSEADALANVAMDKG